MLAHLVVGFFVSSAIVLFWLGREHRDPIERKGSVEAGMSEAEVIASIGPPQEIRRTRDPLDPGFFAKTRRETYVYANRRAVYFERGHVVGVGKVETPSGSPSPPAQLIPNRPAADAGTSEPFRAEDHTSPAAVESAEEVTEEKPTLQA